MLMPNASVLGRLVLQMRALPSRAAQSGREARRLMTILVEHRWGQRWTRSERVFVSGRLRALAHAASYAVLFVLPGSVLSLPLLAWWLRRQDLRRESVEARRPREK